MPQHNQEQQKFGKLSKTQQYSYEAYYKQIAQKFGLEVPNKTSTALNQDSKILGSHTEAVVNDRNSTNQQER